MEESLVVLISSFLVFHEQVLSLVVISNDGDTFNQFTTQGNDWSSTELDQSLEFNGGLDVSCETSRNDDQCNEDEDNDNWTDNGGQNQSSSEIESSVEEETHHPRNIVIELIDIIGASVNDDTTWGGVEETHWSSQNIPDNLFEDVD